MLEKLSIKNLYKIIGSVILAVIIFFCVIIFASKNKTKPDKTNTSGKASDSSMMDESSDKDSSDEDSSSTDDSKSDSSLTNDSSAVVTDVQGKVIPTAPSSGGTQTQSGSTTTKTPTGTTTPTTPSTQTMAISLYSFTPYAEKNINTGLGVPVFEYIFGKQTIENGIPTKCIQQNDTVVLKTNLPITSLDFDSSLINATYSGNTIMVTAKYRSGQYDMKPTILTVNGKYRYNFKVFETYSFYNYAQYLIAQWYWISKGKMYVNNASFSYTNGDVNKSLTKAPIKVEDKWYDDSIHFKNGLGTAQVLNLLDRYIQNGYNYMYCNSHYGDDLILFVAKK